MGIRGRFLFLLLIVDPFSLLLHDHLKTAIESMYERCFEVIGTEKEYNWEYRRTLRIVHTACMFNVSKVVTIQYRAPDDNFHRSLLCTLYCSHRNETTNGATFWSIAFLSGRIYI
jgi:hypothetical protein